MRKVDPAKHAAKRKEILEAAAALFASKGFDATRTADICQAAGMSSGNLFHYFPSKQAIFSAIFADDGKKIVEQLGAAGTAEDPLEVLYAFMESGAAEAEYPLLAGLMLEVVKRARLDEEFAGQIFHNEVLRRGGLETLLERAKAKGQVEGALDVAQAVSWLIALQEGLFIHAASDETFRPAADPAQLHRIVDTIVRRVK